jgi:hypothetical protein
MANVILVVNDTTALSAGDIAIRDRLQTTLGHTVTLHNDHDAPPSLTGINLVAIAPSSNNGIIGSAYDAATCGVFAMAVEPHTDFSTNTFIEEGNTAHSFDVTAPGDPLVGGLTGSISLLTSTPGTNYTFVEQSTLAPGAVTVLNTGIRVGLARIPQGGQLVGGGSSPTRRVFFTASDDWPALFSADGWTIFDNSVAYAAAPPGQPPVADAGPNQEVNSNTLVQLDGSGSTDSDGTVQGYLWRVISNTGSAITLSSPTAESPTFTSPNVSCTIVLGLIVTDNDGLQSSEDTMQVDVISRLMTRIAQGGSWSEKSLYVANSGSWE